MLKRKAEVFYLATSNVFQFLRHGKHSMFDEQETEYEVMAMSTSC